MGLKVCLVAPTVATVADSLVALTTGLRNHFSGHALGVALVPAKKLGNRFASRGAFLAIHLLAAFTSSGKAGELLELLRSLRLFLLGLYGELRHVVLIDRVARFTLDAGSWLRVWKIRCSTCGIHHVRLAVRWDETVWRVSWGGVVVNFRLRLVGVDP